MTIFWKTKILDKSLSAKDANYKKEIEGLVAKMVDYRGTFIPGKFGEGINSLFGPLINFFKEIKGNSLELDLNTLAGKVTRAHEMKSKNQYISQNSIELINDICLTFLEFMKKVPSNRREQVLDKLYYGLYFKLKQKNVTKRTEHVTALKEKWEKFLTNTHGDIQTAKKNLGITSEHIPIPTQSNLKAVKSKIWLKEAQKFKKNEILKIS